MKLEIWRSLGRALKLGFQFSSRIDVIDVIELTIGGKLTSGGGKARIRKLLPLEWKSSSNVFKPGYLTFSLE